MNSTYHTPYSAGQLSLHLERLAGALGTLSERTRQGVAQALAEAAAGLVGDAIRQVLAVRNDLDVNDQGSRRRERSANARTYWDDDNDDAYRRDDYQRAQRQDAWQEDYTRAHRQDDW